MNQGIRWHILGVVALCATPAAHAEVFKCVDAAGKITYSEKKEANAQCSLVSGEVNVVSVPKVVAPPPRSNESNERNVKSESPPGQIAEQARALIEAKKALAEQESIRFGGEQNYQRVLDRLQPFQDKVTEIEKKLVQLRAEQSKAK